jgi:CheY-like chemotaxis protein
VKLLIVEDDETTLAFFEEELAKSPVVQPAYAKSRDSAFAILKRQSFDLVILDLKIPTTDGSLDADLDHGLAVHAAILHDAQGTPVVIFSGFGTVPLLTALLDKSKKHDVWGTGVERTMAIFRAKSDMADCFAQIREVVAEIAALWQIEISFGTDLIDLSYEQRKVLRIFARRNGGRNVHVTRLGGGLSAALTCRIVIQDNNRVPVCYAAVKLGDIRDLEHEYHGYQLHVAPRIRLGGFAHVIDFIKAGAGGTGGLFYGLAKEHDSSLLDEMRLSPATTDQIVNQLRALETTWQTGAPASDRTVAEMRRDMIEDSELQPHVGMLPFDWQRLEQTNVRVSECPQHGDLHGLNVLLKNRAEPLLIDFGAVGLAPSCIDPLVLELSLLFHPACRRVCGAWPTVDQAKKWDDLDAFTGGCPFPAYIRACRKWAFEIEAGDKAVFATAYAFSVRQLKFGGIDHDLAIAVAEVANRRIMAD